MPTSRACGAATPRRGRSRRRWPGGEKPGNVARRRFSRRGALCAPAFRGHTHAEARHCHRWKGDRPVGKRRLHVVCSDAVITGVRSPPLRGGIQAQGRWPYGVTPEGTRHGLSSRRGALCAPALYGHTRTEIWHDNRGGAPNADSLAGMTSRLDLAPICGRAEPAPPRRRQARRRMRGTYCRRNALCTSVPGGHAPTRASLRYH